LKIEFKDRAHLGPRSQFLRARVHPATRLIIWLVWLIVVQRLSGIALFAAFLALPLWRRAAISRGLYLIFRARWLLCSLFFVFAWGVAGEALWEGALSPTREGLSEAMLHLARLSLALMSIAAFLETIPFSDLLAATHVLLTPLWRLGLDTDRGIVRLMLALRYVETLPRPRDWKSLLDAPETSDCETIEIDSPALRWIDGSIVAGLAIGLTLFCFR
jgi:energy-coupling factor transporter transmembrane protein EcfT